MVHAQKIRVGPWEKRHISLLRDLIGQQERELLDALFDPTAPKWLRQIPAVAILRQVWMQNYQRVENVVQWRSSENIPPASLYISSPYE